MATTKQRNELVRYMEFLVAHASQIHYGQNRPMETRNLTYEQCVAIFKRGGTITMDCSEAVTLLCRWAALKSPNGFSYASGDGNSGSMYGHLSHYSNPEDAHPGALVVYGEDGDEHVCMVMSRNGDNPWLFSHGSEIGPLHITLDNESAAHAGQPRAFLDISKL